MFPNTKGVKLNSIEQSGTPDLRRALQELRIRTTANLRAFNDAVPHASWLRRSEIERFTDDLLRATQQAPQRRQLTSLGRIRNAFSWITRARTGAAAPLKQPETPSMICGKRSFPVRVSPGSRGDSEA